MTPRPHQVEKSDEALAVLRENNLVYLSMQERTGKTLTSILTAEKFGAKKVLVVTKKKALPDFKNALEAYNPSFEWGATNYHQLKNIKERDFDLIIIDEAHSYISAFPDQGSMWFDLAEFTLDKPIIYLSATPHAQGYQLMFNQLALSSYSPWGRYVTPLDWFQDYGFPESFKKRIRKGNRSFEIDIPVYTNLKTQRIEREIGHLFVSGTREELGFEHEPEDVVHYLELWPQTKEIYNFAVLNEQVIIGGEPKDLTEQSALRAFLHQLEGGVGKTYKTILNVQCFLSIEKAEVGERLFLILRLGEKSNSPTIVGTNRGTFTIPLGSREGKFEIYKSSIKIEEVSNEEYGEDIKFPKSAVTLKSSKDPKKVKVVNSEREIFREFFNTEKVDYILHNFGDNENVAIMYHFKAEKIKLERFFKKATLLQGATNAEGIDLSHFDHLIIYSQDYSTSRHSQRRARQANMNRKAPINVHFLLVRGAVSAEVYEAVSINKTNFVDNRFRKKMLR